MQDIHSLDITKGRTERFNDAVKKVSEYIEQLPLTSEENNKLISLLLDNIAAAEVDAFLFGINIASTVAATAASEKREPEESDFIQAAVKFGALE